MPARAAARTRLAQRPGNPHCNPVAAASISPGKTRTCDCSPARQQIHVPKLVSALPRIASGKARARAVWAGRSTRGASHHIAARAGEHVERRRCINIRPGCCLLGLGAGRQRCMVLFITARRAADLCGQTRHYTHQPRRPDRALCAPARSTFVFGGCIDRGRAGDERR
jgi:hypothetical protein